jgi:polar amino acid transport system substrate-binding protein
LRYITFLLLLFILFSTLYAEEIYTLTEDYPPLNFTENENVIGPSVEIVKQISLKNQESVVIKIMPWKRARRITISQKNTSFFSMARTEDRDILYKWVGPIATVQYVFIAKKSESIKIGSLPEIKEKNYKVGCQLDGFTEDDLIKKNITNRDLSIGPDLSFQKLNAGRIQLWYTSKHTPKYIAKRHVKIDIEDYEIVFEAEEFDFYIAFNKDTDDEIISLWQNSLDELKKNGAVFKIYEKYNLQDLYPGE